MGLAVLFLFVMVVYVFGPERESASRFLRPTFVSGNSGPEYSAPYTTRRVCVDRVHDGIATSTLNRPGYLSGGELVGAPVLAMDPDGAPPQLLSGARGRGNLLLLFPLLHVEWPNLR